MRLSALNSDRPYLRTAAARITNSPFDSQAGIESLVAEPCAEHRAATCKASGAGRSLLLGAERLLCRRGNGVPDAERKLLQSSE